MFLQILRVSQIAYSNLFMGNLRDSSILLFIPISIMPLQILKDSRTTTSLLIGNLKDSTKLLGKYVVISIAHITNSTMLLQILRVSKTALTVSCSCKFLGLVRLLLTPTYSWETSRKVAYFSSSFASPSVSCPCQSSETIGHPLACSWKI